MWISLFTLVLGLAFFITALAAFWVGSLNKGFVEDFTSSLKEEGQDWNWWVFLLSLVAVVAGGGYFIDFFRKKAKFNKLMDTNSKKAFLEKQDDIEVLAWKLGTSFEEKVDEKVATLRIKR